MSTVLEDPRVQPHGAGFKVHRPGGDVVVLHTVAYRWGAYTFPDLHHAVIGGKWVAGCETAEDAIAAVLG